MLDYEKPEEQKEVSTSLILDIKDKEKTQEVPFLRDVNGDEIYHYENYMIYIRADSICFYNINNEVEEQVEVGEAAFILGIKDGKVYFNRHNIPQVPGTLVNT